MSVERVLVTGGTGFLAGWAIKRLEEQGYRVRTTVRSAPKQEAVRAAVGDGVEFAIADLTSPDGWAEAVAGCDYVLHPASPLGGANSAEPDDFIVPAREGTLNVLRAATAAGVKRVVMTSAANTASPAEYTEEGVFDETLVSEDDPSFGAYRRSKIVAERAAWDFMAAYAGTTTLTTVLPGAVFGPVLSPDNLKSVQIVAGLLDGRMPGVPRIGLEVVDVRDVIDLHLAAMTAPEAAGQRFLGTGEFMWMSDVARTLKNGLDVEVPTAELPDEAVRQAARSDANLEQIVPALGRRSVHSADKAKRLLGWQPRPGAETVIDTARSILAWRSA
ncbi:NAD-dependent epimerase/dehydratase family protein [Actinoplanes sp. LDG1-06]|uniref:NAD-dependent epimerase/dehydratase family protein n=1 Tax=Paractinoplanes ovalisporus TaxID=2810368 RepID=A0ABS2AKL1_9ACTN|nr:NAD-dependent epimerase/dehydratase family protein [Actinoplanes ovalisporus]MBM2620330.1 NAD-dependent epimerase/dehydratase family protein [Actinoplanes ovalisporus]